jgi:polygalacturonase
MSRVQNVEISGVKFRNSPRYHIAFDESDSIYIHDLEIEVDMLKQKDPYLKMNKADESSSSILKSMLGEYSYVVDLIMKSEFSWPVFPLNTDGIDPAGSNVTIRNLNITSFDDAVAVKP